MGLGEVRPSPDRLPEVPDRPVGVAQGAGREAVEVAGLEVPGRGRRNLLTQHGGPAVVAGLECRAGVAERVGGAGHTASEGFRGHPTRPPPAGEPPRGPVGYNSTTPIPTREARRRETNPPPHSCSCRPPARPMPPTPARSPRGEGRETRRRVQVHRRPVGRRRRQRLLHRPAERPHPEVGHRRQADHVHGAVRPVQRAVLRQGRQALGVRRREERTLEDRREDEGEDGRREGLRRQAAQRPERRVGPARRRGVLHRPVLQAAVLEARARRSRTSRASTTSPPAAS